VHFENAGASSFQTLERLLSLLALDIFLFGTAMFSTSLKLCIFNFPAIYLIFQGAGQSAFGCNCMIARLSLHRKWGISLCNPLYTIPYWAIQV